MGPPTGEALHTTTVAAEEDAKNTQDARRRCWTRRVPNTCQPQSLRRGAVRDRRFYWIAEFERLAQQASLPAPIPTAGEDAGGICARAGNPGPPDSRTFTETAERKGTVLTPPAATATGWLASAENDDDPTKRSVGLGMGAAQNCREWGKVRLRQL